MLIQKIKRFFIWPWADTGTHKMCTTTNRTNGLVLKPTRLIKTTGLSAIFFATFRWKKLANCSFEKKMIEIFWRLMRMVKSTRIKSMGNTYWLLHPTLWGIIIISHFLKLLFLSIIHQYMLSTCCVCVHVLWFFHIHIPFYSCHSGIE